MVLKNRSIKRFFNVLLASQLAMVMAVSVSGCARKDKKNDAPRDSVEQKVTLTLQSGVTYRAVSGKDASDMLGRAPLVKSDMGWKAKNSLVLSSSVPDEIEVEVALKNSDLRDLSQYSVRGIVFREKTALRMIPEPAFLVSREIQESDKAAETINIRFPIKELRAFLSDQKHESVSVSVVISERATGRELKVILFDVESPPSQLTTKAYLPFTLYEQERKVSIPSSLRRLTIPNFGALELVGLIELQNDGGSAYELQVPVVFSHEFIFVSRITSAQAFECGYNASESVNKVKLPSRMFLLPITQDMERMASASILSGGSSAHFEAGNITTIGVYSDRSGALTLPANSLQSQTVPSRCVGHCTSGGEGDWADEGKWGGACVACGRSSGNSGSDCYSCMRTNPAWCRWQRWNSWKDYTNVMVGSVFELEVIPEDGNGRVTDFAMGYSYQEVPPRKIRVLTEKVVIQ